MILRGKIVVSIEVFCWIPGNGIMNWRSVLITFIDANEVTEHPIAKGRVL